jgi:hypothetical protein
MFAAQYRDISMGAGEKPMSSLAMIDCYAEGDAAANLLERRWFSSITAARTAEVECEVLREVMERAEVAWRRARLQLAELESLRDALGDELAAIDEQATRAESKSNHRHHAVMSAA